MAVKLLLHISRTQTGVGSLQHASQSLPWALGQKSGNIDAQQRKKMIKQAKGNKMPSARDPHT